MGHGQKELGRVRRVCTACGREGCSLLMLPPASPKADHPVHSGERICKRCYDKRVDEAKRSALFARCSEPVPAPALRECCGGCRSQAVGSVEA